MSNATRKNWMRRWRRAVLGKGYVIQEVMMPEGFLKKFILKDDGRKAAIDSRGAVKIVWIKK